MHSVSPLPQQDAAQTIWDFIGSNLAILWKDWSQIMVVSDFQAFHSRNGLEDLKFTLRGECPHCSEKSVFTQVTDVHVRSHPEHYGYYQWVAALQCQGCLEYILGIARYTPGGGPSMHALHYEEHYPLGKPDETLGDGIPDKIASAVKEGVRCRWVKSYRACAVMCRRAIQASAIELGASPNKKLNDQIDELAARNIITSSLQKFAHEIRDVGNIGAHPDKLDDVSERDADDIMAFTIQYLEHVYVMPAKLKARQKPSLSAAAAAPVSPAPKKNP